jgi:fatty acid desaturase
MSTSPVVTLAVIVSACYIYYLGQIVIHNCVHASLFRRRSANRVVGTVLCALHLVHFEGWRVAHLQHHKAPNTPSDPHRVDRSMVAYMFTHYFRIARLVWEPRRYLAATLPVIALAVAVPVWQWMTGHGLRGLQWMAAFWLIPMIVSHLLVAHFNYITHEGMPAGRGQDTRSFRSGLWWIVNKLTFNFYLHAEHHLKPTQPIPRPIVLLPGRTA